MNDTFFSPLPPIGIPASLNCQLAQLYISRRDAKAIKILHKLISTASRTGAIAESYHPVHKTGCDGQGHHLESTAAMIQLICNLFVQSSHEKIHLTPMIDKKWINAGKKISVKNMTTHFGPISFTLESSGTTLTLSLNPTFIRPPKSIEISLPAPIDSITINKKTQSINGLTAELSPDTTKATLTLLA